MKLRILTWNLKLGQQIWPQNCNVPDFYEIWHSEQTKHANYECSTWNWWFWPKIIDSGKFGPSTGIFSDFHEIWHSQQIEHVNYEYNTCQCLALVWLLAQNDYRLRMIIGCKIWLTVRTWLIALTIEIFNTTLKVIKTWD